MLCACEESINYAAQRVALIYLAVDWQCVYMLRPKPPV